MKVGSVEDFSNFVNAVIDERSFDKIKGISTVPLRIRSQHFGWR
jgi:hypothetical protein